MERWGNKKERITYFVIKTLLSQVDLQHRHLSLFICLSRVSFDFLAIRSKAQRAATISTHHRMADIAKTEVEAVEYVSQNGKTQEMTAAQRNNAVGYDEYLEAIELEVSHKEVGKRAC